MISVIVPIYNEEKYLRQCLESLANQTFKDMEVIMVNDGSTDLSREICEEYVEKHNNFVLLNKENGGQMSAWILGVSNAKGDYFGFVDSDDYVAPDMYEKMMTCEEKTGADLVMCNFYDLSTDEAKPRNKNFKSYYGEDSIGEIYEKVFPTLTDYISMSRWDKLFKRDIYLDCTKKYCNYVVRTMEDRFIVSTYFFHCKSFAYVSEPLYYWRKCKISSSRKPRPELIDIVENLYATQMRMLKDRELYEQYKNNLEVGKIDLLRSTIERNLSGNWSKKEKLQFAGQVLSDENRHIIISNKSACTGKFGKFFYYVCKLNCRHLLVVGTEIMNKLRPDNNENAFI